ncbi:MAG: glycosyltransferase family 39 protein [Planctomycetia bacterium]|nr:glycosyltransferase family 39 protein [Planctomycetia bacterium]
MSPATAPALPASIPGAIAPAPDDHRLGWKGAALVVLFAASLLYLMLGGTRVLTYHEVLFCQPAKEMVAGSSWVLPRFAGVPSTHKPPGAHWLAALAMLLTGSTDEGVVRLPAATAGVLSALLIGVLAARWLGRLAGVVAGLMQATTYYVLQLARLAECDMLLVLAVTVAMGCFAIGNIDSPRGRVQSRFLPCLFQAAVAAAFFFKGLIGPAFVYSACGLFALWSRERRVWRFLFDPIGCSLFVLSVGGWFAAAYAEYPAILHDQVMHHFGRFQGEMGGEKDPLFYAYSIPLIVLPWTPAAVLACVLAVRRKLFSHSLVRLAICWMVPGVLLLSLSTFKSKHYAAPLMPPLVVAGAMGLLHFVRRRQEAPPWTHAASATAGVVGCAAAASAVGYLQPKAAGAILAIVAVLGAGLLAIGYFESRGKLKAELACIFVTAWLAAAAALVWIMPAHDSYRDQAELAGRINAVVPAGQTLVLLRLPENQITYYLDGPVARVDEPGELPAKLPATSGRTYVLAPEFLGDELRQRGVVETLDRCASINRYLTESERLTLFAVRAPAPATTASATKTRGQGDKGTR